MFLLESGSSRRPDRARAHAARPLRPSRCSGPHAGLAWPRLRRTRSGGPARTGAPSRASGSGAAARTSRSTTSSDLSCSAVSSASASYSSAICATSAAACSVQPPANTDTWRSMRCSRRRQLLVAPLHRRVQRLVARQRAAAAGEQAKAIIQPRGNLGHRQHRHARRRQLDRQRDAVEAPADLRDRRGVAGIRPRSRAARAARGRRRRAPTRRPAPLRRSSVAGSDSERTG